MRLRIALTVDLSRRPKRVDEDFEHRDVDTMVETTAPGPSVVPLGFTADPPEE